MVVTMNTTLENKKRYVSLPAGLMLIFCAIPVFVVASYFDFGHNYISVMQICFGYMWLWFLGISIYWHYNKVITSTWQYVLVIAGLIFNGLVVLFLPNLFGDSFTDLFW